MERVCKDCGLGKPVGEFYTKGDRLDSKCKECVKKIKRRKYRRNKRDFETHRNNRVTKVVMRRASRIGGRELAVVRSILADCLVNILTEERCRNEEKQAG